LNGPANLRQSNLRSWFLEAILATIAAIGPASAARETSQPRNVCATEYCTCERPASELPGRQNDPGHRRDGFIGAGLCLVFADTGHQVIALVESGQSG